VFIIVCIYIAYTYLNYISHNDLPPVTGSNRSKLEARLIAIVEDLTGHQFPQDHIRDDKTNILLELDGYNDELKLAIEVQGPHHHAQLPKESYKRYLARIARDEHKLELCKKYGIKLISLDYNILSKPGDTTGARDYIASRLQDLNILPDRIKVSRANYLPPQKIKPWTRSIK
jgi:hypothetical protein